MRAAHKILAAAACVTLAAGGFGLIRRQQRATTAVPIRPATPALPAVALDPADAGRLTKIALTRPADQDDDGAGDHPDAAHTGSLEITMERRGSGWQLTTPIVGEASGAKVNEAIQNLRTLHLWKRLDAGTSYYDQYDLTADKALHIVAWRGADKVVDLFCGKGSTDGQLVRLPDRDGMYALVNWGPQGYSGFLFTRALRDWRETSIFNFAPERVVGIEIRNPTGELTFAKIDGRWLAMRRKPNPDGHLGRAKPWFGFDAAKLEVLLRDYRTLAAEDFGDRVSRTDAGVDDAERTGGVIRLTLEGGNVLTLRVGKPAKNGTTRWAMKDSRWAIKEGGDGTLYAVAPWPAAWATADAHKFE